MRAKEHAETWARVAAVMQDRAFAALGRADAAEKIAGDRLIELVTAEALLSAATARERRLMEALVELHAEVVADQKRRGIPIVHTALWLKVEEALQATSTTEPSDET
jgi:hypothetical protein